MTIKKLILIAAVLFLPLIATAQQKFALVIGNGNYNSISIPSSVTSIENYAFYYCTNLTGVTLSRRTQLGENVFPDTTRFTYRD